MGFSSYIIDLWAELNVSRSTTEFAQKILIWSSQVAIQ